MESVPVLVTIVVALAAVVYTVYLYKQEVSELETRLRQLETPRLPGVSATKKYRKLADPHPSDTHSEGVYTSLHRSAEPQARNPEVVQARVVEYREKAVETDHYSDREKKRPREEGETRDPREIRKKALAGSNKNKQDKVAMYLSANYQRSKERFMATIGDLSKKGAKSSDRRYESPKAGKGDPLLYTSPSEVRVRDVAEAPARPEANSEKQSGSLFGAASTPPSSLFPASQASASTSSSLFTAPKDPPSASSSFGSIPAATISEPKPAPPPSIPSAESPLFGTKPSDKSERPTVPSASVKGEPSAAVVGLFGAPSTSSGGSLFGSIPPAPASQETEGGGKVSMFGAMAAPAEKPNTESKGGSSLFGEAKPPSEKKESLGSLFMAAAQPASTATEKPAVSLFAPPPSDKPTSSFTPAGSDAPSLIGNTKPTSLFGPASTAPAPMPSLLNPANSAPAATTSLFGPVSTTPSQLGGASTSQSLFANPAASQASPVVFGTNKPSESGFNSSLFGPLPVGFAIPKSSESSGQSLFGDSAKSLFGQGQGSAPFPGTGGSKS